METITSCRVCGSKNITGFFDLGRQPLANSLLKSPDEKEDIYPLSLSHCPDCALAQLNETVEPEKLFSQYVWVTGTSRTAQEYAKTFFREITARTAQPKTGYVLEIASNDGTFLRPFIENEFKVLGVDPAENIAEMARRDGIPTEAIFFGAAAVKNIAAEHGQAQIVFARNVLPHVANTRDFVEGLALSLADGGTLAIEAHYAKIIQEELHYDSIYHEHLCYFTLKSLERLLADFGLFAFDIMKSPISGGSMVIYAGKNRRDPSAELQRWRQEESASGINDFDSWKKFAVRAEEHKSKLLRALNDIADQGGRVIGWGASARSSTMLNFAGIGPQNLPVIIDLNPLKQKLYTAGTHIPIDGAEAVMRRNPTHVFILAWNFADEIMDTLKNKFNFHGECLVPLPGEPRLVKL